MSKTDVDDVIDVIVTECHGSPDKVCASASVAYTFFDYR